METKKSVQQAGNHRRAEATRKRLDQAYRAIFIKLTPETTVAQRKKMIKQWIQINHQMQISFYALEKNKAIWHPQHNGETLVLG